MKNITRCIAALVALSVLASCSKPPPVRKNACDLLTETDAAEILGAEVEKPAGRQAPPEPEKSGLSSCVYASNQNMNYKQLSLFIRFAGSAARDAKTPEKYAEDIKNTTGRELEQENIEGLEYRILWEPTTRQLSVFRGNDIYIASGPDLESAKKVIALSFDKLKKD